MVDFLAPNTPPRQRKNPTLLTFDSVNREDLQAIARTRLREAKSLLNAGFPDGAFDLAGYAVECGLKALHCEVTRRYDFPDKTRVNSSHTHKIRELVKLGDLDEDRRTKADTDPAFRENWDLVQQWSEDSRYGRRSADSASALIAAIDNRKHGAMAWLKLHW
jgi:HEPN domain-containing protein